ncbi:hypothetical protein C0992_007979 [Termitomyces sp. T32_za158]|nr:hypothetical protein C0992_007979 [Termitomyces sp. T32_za158]
MTRTRLTWVGSIPSGPKGNVTGSYTIDGTSKHDSHFNVSAGPVSNDIFFTTHKLYPTSHHWINVTYTGNGTSDPPLVLHYVYIDTGTRSESPFPAPLSSNSTSTQKAGSGNDAGKIAGGVIGGIVFLLALLAIALFLTRRRRRHRYAASHRHSDISVREPLSPAQAQVVSVPNRRSAGLWSGFGFGYSEATIEQTRAMKKGEEAARESRHPARGQSSVSYFTEPLPVYKTS